MIKIVKDIVEIISDYRIESGMQIDNDHILEWVSQFNEDDQKFLLSELLHILPYSYLSKKYTIKTLTSSFDYLKNKYKHDSVADFLSHANFLSCQAPEKSQTILLKFLNEFSQSQYGLNLEDCGNNSVKYWIYFDDVLASGKTFRDDIIEKIESCGVEEFKKDKIKIIGIFFFLHSWGRSNSEYILKKFNEHVAGSLEFHRVYVIENDPRISRYNQKPKFNHVFPAKDDTKERWDQYLESLEADRQVEYAYRPNGYPRKEDYYSSPESRQRYESIILDKGLDILDRAAQLSSPIRPLGLVPPSYRTFGTGSHAFTWRNISNTCPIVFWWENHGWYPLFSVEHRGI